MTEYFLQYFLGSLFFGPFVTLVLATTRETPDGSLQQVDLWKGNRASAGRATARV